MLRAVERGQQIGIAGLGKMGAGIALNLVDHGWEVAGWNRTVQVAHDLAGDGVFPADTLEALVAVLRPPRVVWLMVPAGKPVDTVLFGDDGKPGLVHLLESGDIVIDGGNSRYTEDAPSCRAPCRARTSPSSTAGRQAARPGHAPERV